MQGSQEQSKVGLTPPTMPTSSDGSRVYDRQRIGSRVVGGVMAMVGAVTAVSLYSFYRVDRVQENVELSNQFYVPVLKHLNVLGGKWSAYQRTFEQSVNFRKWGAPGRDPYSAAVKINLRRMVEANLAELERRAEVRRAPEAHDLRQLIERIGELAGRELSTLAAIETFLKNKHYSDAAAVYSQARSEHLVVTQELSQLSRTIESRLGQLQLSTERELRKAQSVMLFLLAASLLFSLVVLLRLRRWLLPIVEWTRVAQEIALKGSHSEVRFPVVRSGMPPEISLLTREFTRMGTTLLERERTIQQQKQKLESLNGHLKEQNLMLRKLGALNERILNGMSSGLLVLNAEGGVEQFNERYCELFCTERSGVLGRPASGLLAGWPAGLVGQWLGATEALHQARLEHAGRVFDVRVQLLQAEGGRLLMFEDVSDLVAAEEKLEHARKLVLAGNLSAQVAHEVRNPLNSMSLQLELLEEDVADAAAKARVGAIAEQVERLDRITRRYLDVGRTQSKRRDPVDFHRVVESCAEFLSRELQAESVRLELRLNAESTVVGGDADAISQVVFNLVRNALESLREVPAPRFLRIETTTEGGLLRCLVSDNGKGIPPEVRRRLFEPFVTTKALGHGLGLSVSRQICIEHGGELKLAAGESGPGAVFEFSLPLIVEMNKMTEEEHAPNPGC